MGVIKRGVLGGFSGKVANVVGSSWKGIAVMKSLPLSVANPRTVGQVQQRTRFTSVVKAASEILTQIVKPLWDRFAQRESGYNAFVSKNINAWDVNNVFNPLLFFASIGTLLGVSGLFASFVVGNANLSIVFNAFVPGGNALVTDRLSVTVYNETQDIWTAKASIQDRSINSAVVALNSVSQLGDVIHVWVSMARADGSIVSTSNYVLAS